MAKIEFGSKKYDSDDVGTPTPTYNRFMSVLHLLHTLIGGTKAMRDAGKRYLPQEKGEKVESYGNRLARSFLINAFKRTVQRLTGEVFSKAISVPEEMDDQLREVLENVDLQKNDLTSFSKEVFKDGITDGIVHVLVELPAIESMVDDNGKTLFKDVDEETGESTWRPLTYETMEEKGWRPYCVEVKAENLIGARTRESNGETILEQIRILETSIEPDGLYGVKEVKRIRVIEENTWETFVFTKEKDKESWVPEKSGVHNRGYIPLESWVIGEEEEFFFTKPPMEDLAYMNLAHWQSYSDQRNILHYARMITYFGKKLDLATGHEDKYATKQSTIIGANVLIHSEDEAGDLKVVEHSGQAIEAGRNDLKDLEQQMRSYGLGLVMGKQPGTETATAKAIDTAESDSTLKSWAVDYESFINRVVKLIGRSMGMEDVEEEVKVNTDFKSFLRNMEVRELREAYLDGLLPREVVFDEYKRRGIIKDDLDFVEVLEQLKAEEEDKARRRASSGFGFGFNTGE